MITPWRPCFFFVASTLLYNVGARPTKSHHNTYYATTTFNDGHSDYKEDHGQVAAFSNTSVTSVKGKIYEPAPSDRLFSCSRISSSMNTSVELPVESFIVFLPLGDCPYNQARTAEKLGAAGILFYSEEASSTGLTLYHSPLKTVVSLVALTDSELRYLRELLHFPNVTIVISIRHYSTLPSSINTFYFVLFAFSVLVLLSFVWFFITYVRKCCDHLAAKRRKSQNQRKAMKMIKKLPTKKYIKIDKDSVSIVSSDEPTCAVCLDNFRHNDRIRELPCKHEFHQECIDPWLRSKATCPLCKYHIIRGGEQSTTNTTTVSQLVQSNISSEEINTPSSATASLQGHDERHQQAPPPPVIQSNFELAILASMI